MAASRPTASLGVALKLTDDGLAEVVWQDHTGQMASRLVETSDRAALRVRLAEARAATALSAYTDDRQPLLAAVLPGPDGYYGRVGPGSRGRT